MQIFVEGFPPVSLEDIRRINRLFTAYVFYETDRRGDRTCLCTRCGRRYTVEGLPKLMTPEWRAFMAARHNDPVTCPECGAAATLKSVGKSKGRKNLVEWANVVLFHTDGPTVWAEAGYVRKDYRDGLNPPVEVLGKMCYRFTQGTAEQWRLHCRYRAGELVEEWQRTKSVYEPLQPGAGYFAYLPGGFHAVGLERLKGSFLRYCGYEQWENAGPRVWLDNYDHTSLLRYLAAAALHPQVELLVKMGLRCAVEDLVLFKRKGRGVDWSQTDPRKGFGLTGEELRDFRQVEGRLDLLRWYKRLRRAGLSATFAELGKLEDTMRGDMEKFVRWCVTLRLKPAQAAAYLERKGTGNLHGFTEAWQFWADYLEAAQYLNYDLSVHNVQRPKDLRAAHDHATAARAMLEGEQAEQDLKRRTKNLEQRYGFRTERYFIRPPYSAGEIVAEGKALRHCVGGYADRHISGKLAILFLRSRAHPDRPLCTIEIRGPELYQIHGYRNEAEPCPENPERKPPMELYGEILEPWLAWVKAGSKRDKQGSPVLPGEEKKEGAA